MPHGPNITCEKAAQTQARGSGYSGLGNSWAWRWHQLPRPPGTCNPAHGASIGLDRCSLPASKQHHSPSADWKNSACQPGGTAQVRHSMSRLPWITVDQTHHSTVTIVDGLLCSSLQLVAIFQWTLIDASSQLGDMSIAQLSRALTANIFVTGAAGSQGTLQAVKV